MKSQSSFSTIRLSVLLILFGHLIYSQDQRMERLVLQYRLTKNVPEKETEYLKFLIIDKYLNEGDYQSAVSLNEKIKENAANSDLKNFLSGKAEFLADNYEGSLSFLNKVNDRTIHKNYYQELQLYKLLNHNHLLQTDSVYNKLSLLFLEAGKDTSGMCSEISSLEPPHFFNIKKAARRSMIFPGAGLYYVGEKKHALASALVNFVFLGYTAYSIYSKYYITAILTGASQFGRFYEGGKRASVKIGNKKNRQRYLAYVMKADPYIEKKISELAAAK